MYFKFKFRIFFTDAKGGQIALPVQLMTVKLAGPRIRLERQIFSTIQSHWEDYLNNPAASKDQIHTQEARETKNERGELLQLREDVTVVGTEHVLKILKTMIGYFEDPENLKEEDGIDIETLRLGDEIGPVLYLTIEKIKMDGFPIQLTKKEKMRFDIRANFTILSDFSDPKEKERDQTIEDMTIQFTGTRFRLESQILSTVRSYLEAPDPKTDKIQLKEIEVENERGQPIEFQHLNVVGTELTLQILKTIVKNLDRGSRKRKRS